MNIIRLKWLLLGIAIALQFSQIADAAQRKEGPHLTPIVVATDAQRKEGPGAAPVAPVQCRSIGGTILDWIRDILPSYQKKETPLWGTP